MTHKRLLTKWLAVCCLIGSWAMPIGSQNVALKTNMLHDALLSPNVGIEVGVAPKWTVGLEGELNLWKDNQHMWKHMFLQPEARYWFCQRFAGHFVGVHALGGIYNFGNIDALDFNFLGSDLSKLKTQRYQGWAAGAGIEYGYAHPFAKHWTLEGVVGVGWLYTRFDSYPCANCGSKIESDKSHNYYGPTKLALNLVFNF